MGIKLAAIFADNMVLQRGIPVPVWGWAAPGTPVSIELNTRTAVAETAPDGSWSTRLPPLEAGGPFELIVSGGKTTLRRTNVLVGEVWVCSGQSNMEMNLSSCMNAADEMAAAEYPGIRQFNVARTTELEPQTDTTGQWEVCSPDTAGAFTGAGYFFARELHRKLGVPIGLINSSWGGTIAETWTSRGALESDPFFKKLVADYHAELSDPEILTKYKSAMEAWERQYVIKDTANVGEGKGWHKLDTEASDWETMDLPSTWQKAGHAYSGVFWFRRELQIPKAWAGRALRLSLGATDKSDVTYFNGTIVGSITMEQRPDAWSTPRTYTVPGTLVKAGRNVIAIRVFSNIHAGGATGPADQMHLRLLEANEDAPVALSGSWQYKVESNFGLIPTAPPDSVRGKGNANSPYMLYNNMILPLLPYAIAGAIWYQGESNAGNAQRYRTLFPLTIRCWREAWKQGDFPFYFVQLANYTPRQAQPCESAWAELREAQTMALAMPNTAMAVIIDVGDADDIHPKNKLDVGLRLALPALAKGHGFKDLVYSGPIFRSAHVEKTHVRINFNHVAGGLVARGGRLKGFTVAGKDRKFVWANAVIDGRSVLVSSPEVPNPVAVRYGWAENPACNLYNSSDLPASPFRTDTWPGITS